MNRTEYEKFILEDSSDQVIRASELTESAHASGLVMCGRRRGRESESATLYVFVDPDRGIGVFDDAGGDVSAESDRDRRFFAAKSRAVWAPEWPAEHLMQGKRAYPQFTTLQFARLMRQRTEYGLAFTWFEEEG